jgi:predicted transposase/invertase (TIGR01784 family)
MPRKTETDDLTNPHDKFFKEIFGKPDLAADFVRNYLPPAIVNSLDLASLEVQKESFVDDELQESFADLIYRVRLNQSHKTAFVCLLFEHKSRPDKWAVFQILSYLLKFWERCKKQKTKKLPLVFPILFYHGQDKWEYSPNLSTLFDHRELSPLAFAAWQTYTPNFSYYLCDLSALEETEIRGQAVVRAALLIMKNIARLHEEPQLLNVWQSFGEVAHQSAVQYIRVMLKYASAANDKLTSEVVTHSLKRAFAKRGEKIMAPFVQDWLRQGREQGLQEGRQEGRQKGRQEGRQEGFIELTMRLLEKRIGRITLAQQRTIKAMPIPKLLKLGEDLLDFQSATDLKLWLRQNVE